MFSDARGDNSDCAVSITELRKEYVKLLYFCNISVIISIVIIDSCGRNMELYHGEKIDMNNMYI